MISSGQPTSPLWLVGEAPGEQEAKKNTPFIGPSGWELDKCLEAAGIRRQELFITNVCHARPPGNDIGAWMGSSPKGPEWRRYEDRWLYEPVWQGVQALQSLVTAHVPKAIIALGDTAMWALTGRTGITQWRGSILECQWDSRVQVIPSYHPAYVLRNYPERFDLICDLERAKHCPIKEPEWDIKTSHSIDSIVEFLRSIEGPFVADIETSQRQIKCVGIANGPTRAVCIPLWGQRGNYWTSHEELIIVQELRELFRRAPVVGQNFLYDSFYLGLLWGIRPRVLFDTMIAQGCLLPGRRKSLDYLASLYCEWYVYWKRDTKDGSAWGDQELWTYNAMDCLYTWNVWKRLDELVDQMGQREQFNFLMSLVEPVQEIMLRGIRCDEELKEQVSQILNSRMNKCLEGLRLMLGSDVNPLSPKQLQHIFYEELQLKPVMGRKTGRPTTDDDALEKISHREPLLTKAVALIKDYRTTHLLKANIIDAETPGGRMYTSLNPVGTSTFRFNSTANPMGWGTNLQNVFKSEDSDLPGIRRLFLPDPGKLLVEFDLSKADLRVVVWESEEEELKEALRRGVNIYKDIAADIVKMPYRKAKMFCHGTNYGGKPRTMAANCGITVHEAEVAQARWFGKFPGILRWHRRVDEELRRTNQVRNKFGFRIIFFDRPEGLLPEALAWCPQSTVAIVTNKALRAIWERKLGELLLQVHDSVLLQVERSQVEQVVKEVLGIYDSIVVPYDDPLVIPAECKVGENWEEMTPFFG